MLMGAHHRIHIGNPAPCCGYPGQADGGIRVSRRIVPVDREPHFLPVLQYDYPGCVRGRHGRGQPYERGAQLRKNRGNHVRDAQRERQTRYESELERDRCYPYDCRPRTNTCGVSIFCRVKERWNVDTLDASAQSPCEDGSPDPSVVGLKNISRTALESRPHMKLNMGYVIGLDFGTNSCRALLVA